MIGFDVMVNRAKHKCINADISPDFAEDIAQTVLLKQLEGKVSPPSILMDLEIKHYKEDLVCEPIMEMMYIDNDIITVMDSLSLSIKVKEFLRTLSEKEQRILRLRMEDLTLEQVGKLENLSRERVRQITEKALRKFRHPLYSKPLKEFITGYELQRKPKKIKVREVRFVPKSDILKLKRSMYLYLTGVKKILNELPHNMTKVGEDYNVKIFRVYELSEHQEYYKTYRRILNKYEILKSQIQFFDFDTRTYRKYYSYLQRLRLLHYIVYRKEVT